jgi:hypothetical protein
VSLTVRSGKLLTCAQHWAAILEAVAFLFQILYAVVKRNRPSDFFTDGFGSREGKLVRPLWPNPSRKLQEDFPF